VQTLAFAFTWNIDPVIVALGPFQIRYYGLIFLAVFLGGYYLFRWQVRRAGGSENDATDVCVPGILGVLIGARLGHVLFYEPGRLLSDPLWVFQIWKGGLASHGATVGLLVAIYYYARRHRQSYIECMDRFSFSAALGATLVRVGNFFNSEIVGRVTDGTWGVRFPRHDGIADAPLRHPSQLYEVALGLFVMLVLYLVDRAAGRERRPRGLLIATFFVTYFSGRFFVEFFKEYQVLSSDSPLTMGQILSLPMVAGGLVGLVIALRRRAPVKWTATPEPAAPAPAPRKSKKSRKR